MIRIIRWLGRAAMTRPMPDHNGKPSVVAEKSPAEDAVALLRPDIEEQGLIRIVADLKRQQRR
jgi:hypothetical protein